MFALVDLVTSTCYCQTIGASQSRKVPSTMGVVGSMFAMGAMKVCGTMAMGDGASGGHRCTIVH